MSETNFVFEQSRLSTATRNAGPVAWVSSNEDDWETHKDNILQLYCVWGYPLKATMKEMRQRYGFTATICEYKRHIHTVWGTGKKRNGKSDLLIMARVLQEQNAGGKAPWFNYDGQPIDETDIWTSFDWKSLFLAQAAQEECVNQFLRGPPVSLPIKARDRRLRVEWLFWNIGEYGANKVGPLSDVEDDDVETYKKDEIYDSGRNLVEDFRQTLDQPSRRVFTDAAPVMSQDLWLPTCPEEVILLLFRDCWLLTHGSNLPSDEIQVWKAFAEFLISKSQNMNPFVAAIMRGLPGCEEHEIRAVISSIWKVRAKPYLTSATLSRLAVSSSLTYSIQPGEDNEQYEWGIFPSAFELFHYSYKAHFRIQILRLSYLIEVEDYSSVAEVVADLLQLHDANTYTLYPYYGFLDDLTLTPTWANEPYPLVFLLKLFTKRYLYQIYRNTFEEEEMQIPYQERTIDPINLEGHKCIGDISVSNSQQIISMHKDLFNLLLADEQGKDGTDVALRSMGREHGGWKTTLRSLKPKDYSIRGFVLRFTFENF